MAALTEEHASGPCETESLALKDRRQTVGTKDGWSALGRLLPQHEVFSST